MPKKPLEAIEEHFSKVNTPYRSEEEHKLIDIIVIGICAVICGAEAGRTSRISDSKLPWLRVSGLPMAFRHMTPWRVFSMLDAQQFHWPFTMGVGRQRDCAGTDHQYRWQRLAGSEIISGQRAIYMVVPGQRTRSFWAAQVEKSTDPASPNTQLCGSGCVCHRPAPTHAKPHEARPMSWCQTDICLDIRLIASSAHTS